MDDYKKATENELMTAYLDGDSRAFSEIYERHSRPLYRFILKKCHANKEISDEILQSSFLKFHNIRSQYQKKFPLLQWLYVITRSEVVDYFRKTKSQQRLDKEWLETQNLSQSGASASLTFMKLETLQEWQEILKELSTEAREVLIGRALNEENFEELQSRLNKSSESLRQIFSRSRKSLQKKLMKT